jgi:hypothetical protein
VEPPIASVVLGVKAVTTRPTSHLVAPSTSDQEVMPHPAEKEVVPASAKQDVGALVTDQNVPLGAPLDVLD